jgi:GNAT superfamily N-acetyltransferase
LTADRDHQHIERVALRAWPSAETIEYDGWVLRASAGYTKRANSVNPHFGSSLPIKEKLDHCERFYAERQLPPIFRLTPFSLPRELDGLLATNGYTTLDPTLVMTGPAQPIEPSSGGGARTSTPEEWHEVFEELRDLPSEKREPHRWIVDHAAGERCFAVVDVDGHPTACGLGVLVGETLGLFDLLTVEAHRREGHATTTLSHILAWAHARGAASAFLQVHSANSAAQALYRSFGFEVAYPYWYRIGGT